MLRAVVSGIFLSCFNHDTCAPRIMMPGSQPACCNKPLSLSLSLFCQSPREVFVVVIVVACTIPTRRHSDSDACHGIPSNVEV